MKHLLPCAVLLASVAPCFACGGTSTSPNPSASDGGGGGTEDSGNPADGASSGGTDGSSSDGATSDGGGAWGPCTLASVGDPGAVPITMTTVQPPGAITACGAASSPLLFQTPSQLETFEASLDGGTSGVDGGAPYADLIDWTTYSLLVFDTSTDDALTAGAQGVDQDQIILTLGKLCQGVAPTCVETAYRVPSAATVSLVACPLPSTACNAP